MPTKQMLGLKGPVKSVTYQMTRPDFTGQPVANEVHLEFNQLGYITDIEGKEESLSKYGQLQKSDLSA